MTIDTYKKIERKASRTQIWQTNREDNRRADSWRTRTLGSCRTLICPFMLLLLQYLKEGELSCLEKLCFEFLDLLN